MLTLLVWLNSVTGFFEMNCELIGHRTSGGGWENTFQYPHPAKASIWSDPLHPQGPVTLILFRVQVCSHFIRVLVPELCVRVLCVCAALSSGALWEQEFGMVSIFILHTFFKLLIHCKMGLFLDLGIDLCFYYFILSITNCLFIGTFILTIPVSFSSPFP